MRRMVSRALLTVPDCRRRKGCSCRLSMGWLIPVAKARSAWVIPAASRAARIGFTCVEVSRQAEGDGFALKAAVFHIDWMLRGFEEDSIFKLKI